MRYGSWIVAAALLTTVSGCSKSKKDDSKVNNPTVKGPTGSGSAATTGSGSAATTGSGSATTPSTGSATPPGAAMTAAQMAAQYATCWGYFNDRKWDAFKGCYAAEPVSQDVDAPEIKGIDHIMATAQAFATAFPDGKAEIEMTFVSPPHVVGVVLFTGTQDGPLQTKGGQMLPPSHKKVGLLIGHVIDFDPMTKLAVGEYMFSDPAPMMGQLGILPLAHREPMTASLAEKGTVAIEAGTPVEKTNLDALKASTDAFNKRDATALDASRTDAMTFYDSSTPVDVDKAQMMAGIQMLWKEFSTMQNQVGGAFAANDYVVSYGQLTGTNDGDLPAMKVKATGKSVKLGYLVISHYAGGKIDKGWRFVNGLSMPMQLGLLK